MPRILSQQGNVIAADFARRGTSLTIELKTQILYCDDAVALARVTYLLDGRLCATQHITVEMPATS
jgi:hypothetical protein